METESTSLTKSYIRFLLSCRRKISDYWEEAAQKAGMNISEYLRNLVRGGGNVDAPFTTDRGIFIRQITGIATNVNQIAKVVNTQGYGYTRDILAVKQDLEDVKRLMREVLTVWQSLRYSA